MSTYSWWIPVECGLSGLGRVGLQRGREVPGQELLYAADWVVGNLGQHGAEVEFRVEAVQFCRSDEAIDGGGPLAAATRVTMVFRKA